MMDQTGTGCFIGRSRGMTPRNSVVMAESNSPPSRMDFERQAMQ